MSRFKTEELNAVLDLIADAIEFYASDPYSNPEMRGKIRQLYSEKYYALFHATPKMLEACIWTAKAVHHPACIYHNRKRGDVNACDCYVRAAKAAIAAATQES